MATVATPATRPAGSPSIADGQMYGARPSVTPTPTTTKAIPPTTRLPIALVSLVMLNNRALER